MPHFEIPNSENRLNRPRVTPAVTVIGGDKPLSAIVSDALEAKRQSQEADALLDPEYRVRLQALKDMTAAIDGHLTERVVLSIDANSVLKSSSQRSPTTLMPLLNSVVDALQTVNYVVSMVKNSTTPFSNGSEAEQLHHRAQEDAYSQLLTLCSMGSIEDWLNDTLPESRNEEVILTHLKTVARGLKQIEAKSMRISSGDTSLSPASLSAAYAQIYGNAQLHAFQDALSYPAFKQLLEIREVKEDLKNRTDLDSATDPDSGTKTRPRARP